MRKLCLHLDPARMARWHLWLAADLAAAGCEVSYSLAAHSSRWPAGLQIALRLERIIQRRSGEFAIDPVCPDDLRARRCADPATETFDIVVDCASVGACMPRGELILTPHFDGRPTELGALAALLDGRSVEVEIAASTSAGIVAWPATADLTSLSEAMDGILSRAIELIVQTASNPDHLDPDLHREPRTVGSDASLALAAYNRLAEFVAAKLRRRLTTAVQQRERWVIGLRPNLGPFSVQNAQPSLAHFRLHRDDGLRFWADPMLFEQAGRTWLFCEEFPYATERGIISVAEVAADGTIGPFVPVIERPYHLSYPLVFEDGGQIWMIPESAASKRVELYRAVEFPYRWELESYLVEGLGVCDATILKRNGRYHLFASTTHRKSTSWDSLRIFESRSLQDPFVAHPSGLAMIDCRQSRSAGGFLQSGADTLRPAQDCSRGYGSSLMMCRVDQLCPQSYRQTPVASISPAAPAVVTGTHHYSRSARFEAVDVWGPLDGVESATLVIRPLPAADQHARALEAS